MMKPKPYDESISERMQENVREYEKLHFKEHDEMISAGHEYREMTYEFYTLFHEDSKNHENGITIEFHTLEDPFLSHKSPHQSATYEFVVRKTYPHVQYSQFMTKEQAVKLWKDLAGEREWSRGPNTEHKVRGKIALRLADGYDWKKHEGTIH